MRDTSLSKWMHVITGHINGVPLEHVIFNSATFFSAAFTLLGGIMALFLGMDPIALIIVSFSVVYNGIFYYQGRFKQRAEKFALPTAITMSISTFVLWFFTGGIMGPLPLGIFLSFALSLTFLSSRQHLFWTLYLLISSSILIVLETTFPHWVQPFPEELKFASFSFLFIGGVTFAGFMVWVLKSNYEEERKRVVQKNEELNDFAHVVSHDMKAPLRAIQHLSTFVLEDNEEIFDDEGKDMVNKVIQSADRMTVLINDILTYTRVAENIADKQEVNLPELVEEVILSVNAEDIATINAIRLPNHVLYNRVALNQVIQNLISNAIKYNDKDRPEIRITSRQEGKFHFISIRDNGPGIDPEHHKEIFEFMKTLGIKSRNESGTGIGLALVKRIVEQNGGGVYLDSTPGKGSTFSFSIPA